jgi:hypothetical protein
VNKPINLHYFYSCIHIFYFFYLFYFSVFFIFYFFYFFGLGPAQPTCAGLDPASPAWSLAQASNPAGPHEAHVIQIARAWPLLINLKQAAKMN